MSTTKRLVLNAALFIALSILFPNMLMLHGITTAIIASIVFSVLNTLVKPVLHLLSFPITLITFGLFSLVINAAILMLTSSFMGTSFYVNGFGSAVLLALIISLVNSLVQDSASSKR